MRGMIQNAPLGVFVLMVLFPLAMAGVAVFAGLKARRQSQLMTAAKVVPIGMAEDGYRQFEGTAEAIGGQTVTSPLTGSACVWFSARVEAWTRRGSTSDRSDWRVVRHLTSTAPVLIRDATGACVVRVMGAEVTPRDKSRWTGPTIDPADRNPVRLGQSESWPMVETAGGTSGRYRYLEERIYPGDPLVVVGQFASHRFDAATADDEANDEDDDQSDLDGDVAEADAAADETSSEDADGDEIRSLSTSNRAWNAADSERHEALTQLAATVTKADIRPGDNGQPLIVAATSAANHAYMAEAGSQAAFMIALVPLGLAALVLLARFG